MSKILFTNKEVSNLSKNKWIRNITNNAITYTDDFKIKVIKETGNYQKLARDIFKECGIEPEIVGMQRIYSCVKRWNKKYKKDADVKDSRKGLSGRPLNRELSESEKLQRAEARIKLLEAENELLKKKRNDRTRTFKRHQINIRFEVIKYVIKKYEIKRMTTYLCSCIGVSKSGYYNYLNNEDERIKRDERDEIEFELIMKAYKFKKRKKGARQIRMVLENEFDTIFNIKKIRRLMKIN